MFGPTPIGILLLFLGLAIVAFALLFSEKSGVDRELRGGGVVLIGPIPIVFGSGNNGGQLARVSVILGVTTLLLVYATARRPRGASA